MKCKSIAYEGEKPYAFLSYTHKDEAVVFPIVDRLTMLGYRIWFDDGLHAGDEWTEVIAYHLMHAQICLAMMSSKASESYNCNNEIAFANNNKKPLLPVILEDYSMSLGQQLMLSKCNYLKKNDYPDSDGFDSAFFAALTASPILDACREPSVTAPGAEALNNWKQQKSAYGKQAAGSDVAINNDKLIESGKLHECRVKLQEAENLMSAAYASYERFCTQTIAGDSESYLAAIREQAENAVRLGTAVVPEDLVWNYYAADAQKTAEKGKALEEQRNELLKNMQSLDKKSAYTREAAEIDALSRRVSELRKRLEAAEAQTDGKYPDGLPEQIIGEAEQITAEKHEWKYFSADAVREYSLAEELSKRAAELLAKPSEQEQDPEPDPVPESNPIKDTPPDSTVLRHREKKLLREREDILDDACEPLMSAMKQQSAQLKAAPAAERAELLRTLAESVAELDRYLTIVEKPEKLTFYDEQLKRLQEDCGDYRDFQEETTAQILDTAEAEEIRQEKAFFDRLSVIRAEIESGKLQSEQADRLGKQLDELEKTLPKYGLSTNEVISTDTGALTSGTMVLESTNTEEKNAGVQDIPARIDAELTERRIRSGRKSPAEELRRCREKLQENTVQDEPHTETDGGTTDTVRVPPAILIQAETGELYHVRGAYTTIGRQETDCDFVIRGNKTVSRVHAMLVYRHGHYALKDNKTTWGTTVQGKKLEAGAAEDLESFAVIELSDETLYFAAGEPARDFEKSMKLRSLRSADTGEVHLLLKGDEHLDRNHPWKKDNLLAEKFVSGNHAVLHVTANECSIEDRKSTNGTKVNAHALEPYVPCVLKNGDEITIAKKIRFEYSEKDLISVGGKR